MANRSIGCRYRHRSSRRLEHPRGRRCRRSRIHCHPRPQCSQCRRSQAMRQRSRRRNPFSRASIRVGRDTALLIDHDNRGRLTITRAPSSGEHQSERPCPPQKRSSTLVSLISAKYFVHCFPVGLSTDQLPIAIRPRGQMPCDKFPNVTYRPSLLHIRFASMARSGLAGGVEMHHRYFRRLAV